MSRKLKLQLLCYKLLYNANKVFFRYKSMCVDLNCLIRGYFKVIFMSLNINIYFENISVLLFIVLPSDQRLEVTVYQPFYLPCSTALQSILGQPSTSCCVIDWCEDPVIAEVYVIMKERQKQMNDVWCSPYVYDIFMWQINPLKTSSSCHIGI